MVKQKILENIHNKIEQGPFSASWDSLENYKIPQWYEDAKFGIFIHWGVYCVPAFGNEWYPRNMYIRGSREFEYHIANYGPHSKFGYKDFIPMFKAEKFDPAAWAELFKKSGARYVVPVAEHHDGFQMYDSALSRWNAAQMGPKRDVIGELANAVREQGMIFGVSSHRAEHWWFMGEGMNFDSDVRDPEYADFYGPAMPQPRDNYMDSTPDQEFLEDWLMRTCELIDKYQPQILWFDWWIMNLGFKPYLKKLAAYYYNKGAEWGKGVAINYKYDAFPVGTAVLDIERGQLSGIRPMLWQNDTSVSKNSWGYIKDHDYKEANDIICDLIDVVSKNGVLLLNVGPKADGTIPENEQEILLEIGKWLEVNGEAIYGTRPWKVFGEGPTQVAEGAFTDTRRNPFTSEDIRFTAKDGRLYAIVMKWPENGRVAVKSLGKGAKYAPETINSVKLLSSNEAVQWSRTDNELLVDASACRHCENPVVLVINYS
ncbi:MAG TPA: alpha-L-fucosidase [Clostridiales bacterium]|nr:alpha-L-fucosidase [Clostridiales bacterium]